MKLVRRIHRVGKTVVTHRLHGISLSLEGTRDCLCRYLDVEDLEDLSLQLVEGHVRLAFDTITEKLQKG